MKKTPLSDKLTALFSRLICESHTNFLIDVYNCVSHHVYQGDFFNKIKYIQNAIVMYKMNNYLVIILIAVNLFHFY